MITTSIIHYPGKRKSATGILARSLLNRWRCQHECRMWLSHHNSDKSDKVVLRGLCHFEVPECRSPFTSTP